MFAGASLSVQNYDSLLIGWSSKIVLPNVIFHGGDSKYSCIDGAAARSILTDEPNNWIVTDGGPSELPSVRTHPAEVSCVTAEAGGLIDSNCGSNVISRGLVWSRTAGPTVESNEGILRSGSGMGSFSGRMTELADNRIYYYRAFAQNDLGTSYGKELTFLSGEDFESPVIICPDDITVDPNTDNGYLVPGDQLDPLTVEDNCMIINLINDYNDGSSLAGTIFPPGSTNILWAATDEAGLTSFCELNLIVTGSSSLRFLTDSEIRVSPNPTKAYIRIETSLENILKITVTDMTGSVVIENRNFNSSMGIDLSEYGQGLYILNIYTRNGVYASKIIKQ
jgi:hypothetical protein